MLRRRACREAREKGVGEERSQAKQTNSLRVRQPRGLEFRCGPAPVRREREGESVLNNLVQTGYHTPNQTDRHAKPHKTGKDHNPDREKLRPGASSPCTAQHTCTRPTARRDRHRLHHRGRERNRRRRSQHRAHARESRGRGRGHRRRAPASARGTKSLYSTCRALLHHSRGRAKG